MGQLHPLGLVEASGAYKGTLLWASGYVRTSVLILGFKNVYFDPYNSCFTDVLSF